MVTRQISEKLGRTSLMSLVTVAAMLAVSIPVLVSAERQHNHPGEACEVAGTATAAETPVKGDVATGGGSTLRAEDPVTGQMAPLPPQINGSLSTSGQGLVETQDAGGGRMVNVRGRFRSYMKVTRDDSGQISASCSHEPKP
jgi:hypothetical protein